MGARALGRDDRRRAASEVLIRPAESGYSDGRSARAPVVVLKVAARRAEEAGNLPAQQSRGHDNE
jgi:hypothetical protein